MHDQFIVLYEKGVRRFLVGGSLGVDQWAGEIILRLKEQPEYSDIELVFVLPFPGHDEQWDARSRERLAFLIRHSIQRNRYMVDHTDCLLVVYDDSLNGPSETLRIIDYAKNRKIPIVMIHPHSGQVSYEK